MDDPFALMEEAMELSSDESQSQEGDYHVAYLNDGDIHVCKGYDCPYVELNGDACYVCCLSGICFGSQKIRENFSTGRQAGSSNPDDHAGEPVGGQWKPKKDMHAMSNQAYTSAGALEESGKEGSFSKAAAHGSPGDADGAPKPKGSPRPVKRGARCVDEVVTDDEQQQKRARNARRTGNSRDRFRQMCEEAELTLCKLVNYDKRDDGKAVKAADPRLQDEGVLFQMAMKKYTKECMATGVVPTLDAVHNIALAAANIAAEEKRKASVDSGKQALLLKVRMREQVTSLAVALWQASCQTAYMEGARRGADSFRPFVCGVFYALKRGVNLPDGTVVVPSCPQLAAALPALRSTAANSAAKALHASSHRGLCTLHRSISSCSGERATELYENAARLAEHLAHCVKHRQYDL